MAYHISEDGVFTMFKGDTAEFEVKIAVVDNDGNGGSEYILQDGDELTMTVRTRPGADFPVEFSVTSNTNTITILPEHTAGMEVGKYSADIQLKSGDKVDTVFPLFENLNELQKSKVTPWNNFVLVGEVTI